MDSPSLSDRFRTFVSGYPPRDALGDAWAEHRRYTAFAIGLFSLGIAIGAIMAVFGYNLLELFAEWTGEEIFPDFEETEINARFYITNNTLAFIVTMAGAATFGVLTAFSMVFNGIIVGNIAVPAASIVGLDFLLIALLPHGIFELPSIFLAAAVGFRLVYRFGERIAGYREAFLTKPYLYRTALLVIVAWLMLALAAVIEAHITPALIDALFAERIEALEPASQSAP